MARCVCIFVGNGSNWTILGGNERWEFEDYCGTKIDTKDWIDAKLH